MNILTQRNIHLIGFVVAVGVAAMLNGAMLWKFDDVAQRHAAMQRAAESAPAQFTLERVTIVAPRS